MPSLSTSSTTARPLPGAAAPRPPCASPAAPVHDFAVLCAGLDRVRRGYETHTRTLFDALCADQHPGARFTLFKRSGPRAAREIALHTPFRDGLICRALSAFKGDSLFWEGALFAAAFALFAFFTRRRFRKLIVIEPVVAKTLHFLRRLLPGQPRLLFTHGVCNPPSDYASIADEVHEVNIENHSRLERYLAAAGRSVPHVLLPHFIGDERRHHDREALRRRYGITTPKVLLSVGALESQEKRMDYVIAEAAHLGPEWSLVICGKAVEAQLLTAARRGLGGRFHHFHVDHDRMEEIYRLADVFVTASLNEGFGIVILEAMRAALPVIAHDRELYRWILRSDATCIDLERPGSLSVFLSHAPAGWLRALGARNRAVFERSYTWERSRKAYYDLFIRIPEPAPSQAGPAPYENPVADTLARWYHRIFSRSTPRKLRHRIARRIFAAAGRAYPPPGASYPNITAIASRSVPRTTVFIAHPDDEAFCSGLLCELAGRGAEITLCCLTRGEGGMTGGHPRERLGALREAELREASRHIGIRRVCFLDHVDPEAGAYRTHAPRLRRRELRSQIEALLDETRPDLVLTHGSCGEYWHPAHILLHDEVRKCIVRRERGGATARLLTFHAWDERSPLRNCLNEGDTANFIFDARPFRAIRLQSLLEHRTQAEVFRIFARGTVEDFVDASSTERYHLVP